MSTGTDTSSQHTSLFVCMHGLTSSGFDFRRVMEGWSSAGIVAAEPDLVSARKFEQENGAGSARRLMDDLGMSAVSSTNQLFLEESGPRREQAIEDLKWKVELAQSLGSDRLVTPSAAGDAHTMADYEQVFNNLYEAAEIARPYNISLMLEFTRLSKLVNNVRTSLEVVRTVNHPNLKFMLDVYHLWAGPGKFEDLDLIKPGEVHHVHFQDMPALPFVEVAEMKDRVFPGEGVIPLQRIVDKLRTLDYQRALSLELFHPEIQHTDPAQVAARALKTITPYLSSPA